MHSKTKENEVNRIKKSQRVDKYMVPGKFE